MKARILVVPAVIASVLVVAIFSRNTDVGLGAKGPVDATLRTLDGRIYLRVGLFLPVGYTNPLVAGDERMHAWTRNESPVIEISTSNSERSLRCVDEVATFDVRVHDGFAIVCDAGGTYVRRFTVDTPFGPVVVDCAVYGDPAPSPLRRREAVEVCASLTLEVTVPGFEPRHPHRITLPNGLEVELMVPDRMERDDRTFHRRDRTSMGVYAESSLFPIVRAYEGCERELSLTTYADGWLETCVEVRDHGTVHFSRLHRWSGGNLRLTCWAMVHGDAPHEQLMASCRTLRVRREDGVDAPAKGP